jgi:hypothetical protein
MPAEAKPKRGPGRRATITDPAQLPLVMSRRDFAPLLGCSEKTIERLARAQQLPPPIISLSSSDGSNGKQHKTERWTRDAVLAWLAGGVPRRGRR